MRAPWTLIAVVASALFVARSAWAETPVTFQAHRIGSFRSEACCVGDFNGDGKLDILAGPFLYLAPDWKPVKVRTLSGSVDEEGKGYCDDFMNLPLDVDGDGKLDVVSCGWFCKCVRWFRNTLGEEGEWPQMGELTGGNYECGDLWDVDGDGKPNEILAHSTVTDWFEAGTAADGKPGLVKHPVSGRGITFGGGMGDLNGDGRPDILRPAAWYEGPADPRKDDWVEHSWGLGMGAPDGQADHTPQMLVCDVNADGLADVITSSAHKFGIWWYEHVRQGDQTRWVQHTIDDTWSQAHSLTLGDLDGDGDPDLVTGKRFMAHNGGDPGADGPPVVYWYELDPGPEPKWTRHVISEGEGIGSGMAIPVVDLDADGDLDVIVTGKFGGPVWFENKRK